MWPLPNSNLSSKFMPISEVSKIRNNIPQIYKTPNKQTLIQNPNNSTPFNFDFNYFFGTLFSSGKKQENNNSPYLQNKDNFFLFKTSLEKSSLKITPGSEYKIQNENKNIINQNEQTKKNLYETFNSVKNDIFLNAKNNNKNKFNNKHFLFSSPRIIKKKKFLNVLILLI